MESDKNAEIERLRGLLQGQEERTTQLEAHAEELRTAQAEELRLKEEELRKIESSTFERFSSEFKVKRVLSAICV